jgi:hypothetical protein
VDGSVSRSTFGSVVVVKGDENTRERNIIQIQDTAECYLAHAFGVVDSVEISDGHDPIGIQDYVIPCQMRCTVQSGFLFVAA